MTGEAFTAFSKHTILARTATAGATDDAAFTRGVETSLSPDSKGLLATAFSCRTLGLSGELDAAQQMEYLSGLVIGAEIAGMRADLSHGKSASGHAQGHFRVALVGDAALCRRYILALRLAGVDRPIPVLADASERGLWQLACQAGLIAATSAAATPITPATATTAGAEPLDTVQKTPAKAAPAPAQAHTHAAVPSGAAPLE
jgi:2-dehydro-3-deoxygalactonokinase